MLSIAKVRRGGARYYLEGVAAGREDHRRPGQEPDGVWLGRASAALGLRGSVDAADLEAMLAGADPASGEVLNPAQDRVRVAGFDLTFAAPKSVSPRLTGTVNCVGGGSQKFVGTARLGTPGQITGTLNSASIHSVLKRDPHRRRPGGSGLPPSHQPGP